MKKLLTPEVILDELSNNPEKYPTKEVWTEYVTNLAYTVWDEAFLTKIEKGLDTSNSDEAYTKFFTALTGLGDTVWNIARC